MIIEEIRFPASIPGVRAVTTQRGAVDARNPYSEFNLCDYVGDDALRVLDARLQFCQHMDIELDHLVMPRQSHSTRVAIIDRDHLDATIAEQERRLTDTDALVTALPDVCLGVNTADCVPIVFVDALSGIIGVAHAGWRGTVGHIAAKTVQAMQRLGSHPGHILAAMGVSICADCYEVGDEVVNEFANAGFAVDAIMHRDKDGKAHIDLRRANAMVLQAAGVPAPHIALSHACSRCHSDRYFSARRLGTNSGRTFTAILRT